MTEKTKIINIAKKSDVSAMMNYRIGEFEEMNLDHCRDYIPQNPPALGLYDMYVQTGKTPIKAVELILEAIVDTHQDKETKQ